MNKEWIELSKTLKKVIDYRGKTPKKLGFEWSESGYRALSALNVKTNGLENLDSIKFASEELYKKWMKEEIQRGDILLTSEAPAGQVMVWDSDEKIVLSQRLFALRLNSEFDNYFVKYFLQSDIGQKEINKNTSGSTVFGISAKMFDLIKVPKIKKDRQVSIGKILKSIDAKIELNNKINRELEVMAKTLYDYWFVQFDFPDEEGKPYKSSGGKMVYNAELKREIPEGWGVKTISKWIKKDKSGDWGKEEAEGNYQLEVSCIRGADLNGLNGNGELKAPTRFILEKNSNKLLENHDLIVEISGGSPTQSTGRLAFITEETLERFSTPIICSNFCKALTLKDERYLFNFVYQWNRLYDNGVLFGWEGKTSGIKNLLFESFITNHSEVYPPSKLANKFYDFAKPIHGKIQKNLMQNQHLTALRDWLLPMLMNGQVTVKEAEEKLSMAAEPRVKYGKL